MLRDSKGERHISSWRYALAREALSIAKKKYWEDHPEGPDFEHLLKYHEDHPEAHAEHGQWMAQYYEFHPEQREARRAGALKQFETSESRENHCKVMAKYYEDHPEFGAEHSAKLLRFFEDHPEICELRSVKGSQLHEEHPELGVEHSKRMQNLYSDPEARKKTSEAVKKALAIKRGDIPDDRTLAQIRKADRQRASKLKRNGKELQCPVAQF
jgi:hypothetical protein